MREANISKLIQVGLSGLKSCVTFRNNVGMGWIGQSRRITEPTKMTLPAGSVVILNARPLHAGLCEGSSDLIGWTSRQITQDMVGKTVAVFTAVEVKTDNGRATREQLTFIDNVRKAGGIAGIARSPEEARKIIESM